MKNNFGKFLQELFSRGVEWRLSALSDREDLSITHLIIIIKSEVSTFPIVVIFFRGYVPEMVAPSYAGSFIYIPGKLGFVSFITVQSYDARK